MLPVRAEKHFYRSRVLRHQMEPGKQLTGPLIPSLAVSPYRYGGLRPGRNAALITGSPLRRPKGERMSRLRRYAFAIFVCGLAFTAAWPLDAPVSCFFLAVILSSLYGGRGPAILAGVLSVLAFDYFFLPPQFAFAIRTGSYLRFAVFLASLIAVIWLLETKRSRDEAYLRIGNQYRLVAETAIDAIVSVDGSGRVTFVNLAAAQMFGRQSSEICGMPVATIIPDFQIQNCRGLKELVGRRKTGEAFPIEVSFGEIVAGGNQVFSGFVRDITERRRAAAALRQSEGYLAEAQKLSRTGSFGLVVSTEELFWSEETYRLMECDPNTKPSLALVFSRIHPDDRDKVRDWLDSATKAGDDLNFEHRLLLPSGSTRHVRVVARAIRSTTTNALTYMGAVADITEARQAEAELRRSEAYLAEAQRLTKSGSWAWNVRSGELFWSDEIYRIYELPRDSSKPVYSRFLDRVHPEDRPAIEQRARMEASRTNWVDSQAEFRILLPDGRIKWLHSIANPTTDSSGDILEVVGTVTDVTERKRAEDELHRAFEEIRKLKDRLSEENIALREEIDQASLFEEIVGSSSALRGVLSQVAKVAPTDSTVLITGETGTGKELIARAIHNRSGRANAPFIRINCAVIPQSLIASELFGHEQGAFTGATQRRIGRFELAHRGTILLDEVGELPADTQVALLRVLQEREIERIGGSQPISVDVRVLAATNRDLQSLVQSGTFRQDLFYRLNVFPIQTPPLRDRLEDIPVLVEYLIERYASKAGKKIKKVSKGTLDLLQSYDWPGNIRELQNVVERAVVLSNSDVFTVDEAWLMGESPVRPPLPAAREVALTRLDHQEEKRLIEEALLQSRGRIAGTHGAAVRLGIPRQTLDSKIKTLGIDKRRFKSN